MRYDNDRENGLADAGSWNPDRRGQNASIQPSWLSRDGTQIIDKIRREAISQEYVQDGIQRSSYRSRGRKNGEDMQAMYGYNGVVDQSMEFDFPSDHPESSIPRLPQLSSSGRSPNGQSRPMTNDSSGMSNGSRRYRTKVSSRQSDRSSRPRSQGNTSRNGLPGLQQSIIGARYEQTHPEIKTSHDVIEYYVRNGHSAEVKLFHCNRAETGDKFRPYDLTVVPREQVNQEHFTLSVSGVVHVAPGRQSEFRPLGEWMREQSIFNLLIQMRFFKYFLVNKMFHFWRSNVRHKLYCQVRQKLMRRLFTAKPTFCLAVNELKGLARGVRDTELTSNLNTNNLYTLDEFSEVQTSHRTGKAQPAVELLVERMMKVVERVSQEVMAQEKNLRILVESNPESQMMLGRGGKSRSIVSLKQERIERQKQYQRVSEELKMLGNLVRLADYMLCESLVGVVMDTLETLHGCLESPNKQKGMFLSTVSFTDEGCVFAPTESDLQKVVGMLVEGVVNVASVVPRLLHMRQFSTFFEDRVNGPSPATIITSNAVFQQLQTNIGVLISASYQQAMTYSLQFEEHRPVYLFGKEWDMTAYEQQHHDVSQFRKDMLVQKEWRNELERMKSGSVVGVLFVDSRALRNALTTVTTKALDSMKGLLLVAARAECSKVLDAFQRKTKQLLERPDKLETFCAFIQVNETISAEKKAFMGESQVVDEMYEMLNQYEMKIPVTDQVQVDDLHEGVNAFTEAFADAENFMDERKSSMVSALDRNIIELNENLLSILAELHSGIYVQAESDAKVVLVSLAKVQENMKQMEAKANTYREYQTLFKMNPDDFSNLSLTDTECTGRYNAWSALSNWEDSTIKWMTSKVDMLDLSEINSTVDEASRNAYKMAKANRDDQVVFRLKAEIEDFRQYMSLLQELANPALDSRHWKQIFQMLGRPYHEDMEFSVKDLIDMNVMDKMEEIATIGATASKEYSLLKALEKMMHEWEGMEFKVIPYKDSGTSVIGATDEVQGILDDQIVKVQSMNASPFVKPFKEQATEWEHTLFNLQDMLDNWLKCQSTWLYLEPIFSSEDIMKQMPEEGQKFQVVDADWRAIMRATDEAPAVIPIARDVERLERLKECNALLDAIQKGLAAYLEKKRLYFPRFFFLSNDEMLEILSETKDPTRVQPHLKKCFEGIDTLKFEENLDITAMNSVEKEQVPLKTVISTSKANGAVEKWLVEVESCMFEAIQEQTRLGYEEYVKLEREKWVLNWPGMCVLLVTAIWWTHGVEEAITAGELAAYEKKCTTQLMNIVELVRGQLTKLERATLGALVVMDVHARDVVTVMVAEGVKMISDFSWQCQLRGYWEDENAMMRIMNAEVPYGYEYLGNSSRLVITPLTDRCYRTLMGAIHLTLGGAPEGPAGTGKTETTKDLAKALARQCVVFNCSDSLDYIAMGKFFKGLAASGAWACFDEFNRIDLEVLSVVAQQVLDIQRAIGAGLKSFVFEGTDLQLRSSAWCSITMNPGYAGRSELPDNLKALFRTVAMMVPDYAMISEIILYSFGYLKARECSHKIVATYKLCSEQLSSQDHYDYGMRAVMAVLRAAGNLKRMFPEEDEFVLMLRSIIDVNECKFLSADVPLFHGIVGDLFPGVVLPKADYTALNSAMYENCDKMNLQKDDYFLSKVIQLYEMIIVRHGLMIVGLSFSGKTKAYKLLAAALTDMKKAGLEGPITETVEYYVLNPKSITMGQLYGEFDAQTHEWSDGVLAVTFRNCASDPSPNRKWVLFDGPVDAIWIENMNTVLDDNRKLCLMNSEIIQMSGVMSMIFEVADLAVASPATVSRCGMVYLEPHNLGWRPLTMSWLNEFVDAEGSATLDQGQKDYLLGLFDWLCPITLRYLRRNVKEVTPTSDSNLVITLMRIFTANTPEFYDAEKFRALPSSTVKVWCEAFFLFALVWSVGGSAASMEGRTALDKVYRDLLNGGWPEGYPEITKVTHDKLTCPELPQEEGQMMYEFCFNKETNAWDKWQAMINTDPIPDDAQFRQLIIPTVDTVRYTYLLEKCIMHRHPVLFVGPTGTGKSVYVQKFLLALSKDLFVPNFISFSARTSANATQLLIDTKLDKRKKGVYGPPMGKSCVVMVDDLNMPIMEVYGAQPPIELLRQFMDHSGWYDRDNTFRQMVDVQMVAAMGPPGGGRNAITQRFQRHFNVVSMTDFTENTLLAIFSSIMDWYLVRGGFPDEITALKEKVIFATLEVYKTAIAKLLPTPSKSHYTFNLRDFSRVVQGMLLQDAKSLQGRGGHLRLWIHEVLRVFFDRLVDNEDRVWFLEFMAAMTEKHFGENFNKLFLHLDDDGSGEVDAEELRKCFFGDYMTEGGGYSEIMDVGPLITKMEEYLVDYNGMSKRPMNLAMFLYAVEHVSRVCRVLKQPGAHMLLCGVGGSGRQSLSRLAAFISGMDTFQIEISKSYTMVEWREDLKKTLRIAGADDKPYVFLFSDTQIKEEVFVEDINNILNSGEVPNLYPIDEKSAVMETVRVMAKKAGIELENPADLWAYFVEKCKQNLHMLLCFSPIGDAFRERLRQFPSLINCCTIDWFQLWPADALEAVAQKFLKEVELTDQQRDSIMEVCKSFHTGVRSLSRQYTLEAGRYNYVTPTSYLELLTLFSTLLGKKRGEVQAAKKRYEVGLEKLGFTASQVEVMQSELTALRPNLIKTVAETENLMAVVKKEKTEIVEPKKAIVDTEVAAAQKQGDAANAIKMECEEALSEAMPALEAALAALDTLKPADIKQVQSFKNPPPMVKLVMEAVCVLLDIKPARIPDPGTGKMINDFWEPSKKLLGDMGFMDKLRNYDKDNISPKIIAVIREKYTSMEEFTPANAAKASSAAEGLCKWCMAMESYDRVAKIVAPKKLALAEAEGEYNTVMAGLRVKQDELQGLMDKLADLENQLESSMKEKERLETEVDLCTKKLERAEKLIGGLGGEKDRWTEEASRLGLAYINLTGDMLISAGVVGYLGAFTTSFRSRIIGTWVDLCKENMIPSSTNFTLNSTLGDPVKIRDWAIAGLPNDSFSVDNGIMVANARRWPLMIDPQGQANKWVKNMEKANNLQVVKLTDGDYLRTLENAIQFGLPVLLENVGEELDPSLEPLLLKQIFKQGGVNCIRLGDSTIEYSDQFRFYITTTLRNPHYLPETAVKVTLLNFMITIQGLSDQLLGVVVAVERPDLEEQRSELVIQSAENKRKLKEIEDQILHVLSSSEGNILEDATAVQILSEAKVVSTDIQEKQKVAEATEQEIEAARRVYKPCGAYTAVLFFCVADLANIDPMYQYSLPWFVRLFIRSCNDSDKSDDLDTRLENISDYFTYQLYTNVCMSLFERDKLLYSFLLCSRIMNSKQQLDMQEWGFLLTGGVGLKEENEDPNPAPEWLSEKSWGEIRRVSTLANFAGFSKDFAENIKRWKAVYDSSEPHKCKLPGKVGRATVPFMKVVILRTIRPDKVVAGVSEFVSTVLGSGFVEPPVFNLEKSFKESSGTTPLLFVLSPGSDPTAALLKFADDMSFSNKLFTISMGQGQGPKAQVMIQDATKAGQWVLLQNCHLAASWMPALERITEGLKPDTVDPDFRLWMTSYPTPTFPVSILQNSVKMTNEPPTGVRANLKRTFQLDPISNPEFFEKSNKPETFKSLAFGLAFVHAFVQERRKFGPLGWNIPYGFDDGDLRISVRQLQMFIDENESTPYAALKYAIGECNYGGRVTDDKDRRLLNTLLDQIFQPKSLEEKNCNLSASGAYHIPDPGTLENYIEYINSLPAITNPEVFHLHENADISKDQGETALLLASLLKTGSRTEGAAGSSEEEVVMMIVQEMLKELPPNYDVERAQLKYPVEYNESMNQVLCQEMLRYNKLLSVVRGSLQNMEKAIQGFVVMSSAAEEQFRAMAIGKVPASWMKVSFPCLKPLAGYKEELIRRLQMLQSWFDVGKPATFWISGLFFTPAFLTAALQNYARLYKIPIDEVDYDFQVMEMDKNKYSSPPKDGVYIYGMYLEGCGYDPNKQVLCESNPKVLHVPAPVFWLQPKRTNEMKTFQHYNCPVYRTADRRGVLATTGHSTNFLRYMRVPSDMEEHHWVLRGVCMLCSLPE